MMASLVYSVYLVYSGCLVDMVYSVGFVYLVYSVCLVCLRCLVCLAHLVGAFISLSLELGLPSWRLVPTGNELILMPRRSSGKPSHHHRDSAQRPWPSGPLGSVRRRLAAW